jgi:hypothetical protein
MLSRNKLKAMLVLPAACAGAMTSMVISYPPSSKEEFGFMALILAPFYVANIAALGWLWTKATRDRYFGLTRGTWTFLVAGAYLLGLSLMFLS